MVAIANLFVGSEQLFAHSLTRTYGDKLERRSLSAGKSHCDARTRLPGDRSEADYKLGGLIVLFSLTGCVCFFCRDRITSRISILHRDFLHIGDIGADCSQNARLSKFEGALTLSNADFIKTIALVSALVGGT